MKKLLTLGIIMAFLMILIDSCQYKDIVEPVIPPNPLDTVYFSHDILPIFNDGSNCVSCHNAAGTRPDLTLEVAFAEITNMGLIDTNNPTESLIYSFPNPDTDTHTWKKYTDVQATTILQWIEQGALDN